MEFVFNVDVIVPEALKQLSLKTFTLNASGESGVDKRMLDDKKQIDLQQFVKFEIVRGA